MLYADYGAIKLSGEFLDVHNYRVRLIRPIHSRAFAKEVLQRILWMESKNGKQPSESAVKITNDSDNRFP
jgi:hypothetical protein